MVRPRGKASVRYQAVRVYVEGGGTSRGEQATLREAFTRLLGAVVRDLPRPKLIASGGRGNTLDDFRAALRMHPDASKQDILQKLARALRNTGKQYTKSAGWVLIGGVDPGLVEAACPHARRFFDHLRRACAALPRPRGTRGPGA